MSVIELESIMLAPIERVFDLSRSVDLHAASTRQTGERAVAGTTCGLLEQGQQVTWEATHFGIRQRLTSRIVVLRRPHYFRDSMVAGAFRRFDHDHHFCTVGAGTLVRDRFEFESPWGILGELANTLFLERYMRTFLETRSNVIKEVAESGAWSKYLGPS